MHQGDRIKDPLNYPQLFDLEQIDARRAPPNPLGAIARLKVSFPLSEARRFIDQSFPVPTFIEGEANGRATGVEFAGVVGFLGEPAGNQADVKTTGELHVCPSGCGWGALCCWSALAPVFKQVVVNFLDVHAVPALFRTAANYPPGS